MFDQSLMKFCFQVCDRLFRMEENGVANEIVENVVTFLQYVAHPMFMLSQVRTYQKLWWFFLNTFCCYIILCFVIFSE